jgi:DNA primase large subunit
LTISAERLNPFFMAKYPFVREAREFVTEHFDLGVTDLTAEHSKAIERGFERVCQSVRRKRVSFDAENMISYDVEVLSFPIAVMLVALINDDMLRNVYATAEAKKCSELMAQDRADILEVAKELEIPFRAVAEEGEGKSLAIKLVDYLSFSPQTWGEKWRLVNRRVEGGEVYVTALELARILEEKIKRVIIERTRTSVDGLKLPQLLDQRSRELGEMWRDYRARMRPEARVEPRDVPPCMDKLAKRLTAGENLSHVERRTLVSYLANVGWTGEEIMSLLRNSPDFNERIARYQMEHLTGSGGRGKKYSPPSCATMRMYGLCFPDKWCAGIRHPLRYRRGR